MADFILLMHDDTTSSLTPEMWGAYFAALNASGAFNGGSSIGAGLCLRKSGAPAPVADHITGYIRIEADDLARAALLVPGNPVYECGGTVEIRALPKD